MEIYLDTAKIEEIKEATSWGVISGVTTNPSLMMSAGRGDYQAVTQEICYIVQGPISAEVVSLEAKGMVEEARRIAQWSPHVIIKVPIIPEGLKAMKAISELEVDAATLCQGCPWFGQCDTPIEEAREMAGWWGVRVNATLIFSANQALLAALAGASYVSPFVGRLDDVGNDGMQVVADTVEIFSTYGIETEVIAASLRHPMHITAAALAGADIATVPYKVLMQAVKHPLTDVGVQRFLNDWAQVSK